MPIRRVENHRILSDALPTVAIQVAPELAYVGTLDVVIYDIAQAQLFIFAQDGRQFIAQFEAFLPSATGPEHQYVYSTPKQVQLGGAWYFEDTRCIPSALFTHNVDPASDLGQMDAFVRQQGYTPPYGESHVLTKRLRRILGEDRRAELILIYREPFAAPPALVVDQFYRVSDDDRPLIAEFEARATDSFQIEG